MQKLIFLAGVCLMSLSITTSAMALNPQPEPPGKNRVMFAGTTLRTIGSATGGAGSGRASDADDVPMCGTKVPGWHPHFGGLQNGAACNGAAVMLNPQPLPPRILQGQGGYRQ